MLFSCCVFSCNYSPDSDTQPCELLQTVQPCSPASACYAVLSSVLLNKILSLKTELKLHVSGFTFNRLYFGFSQHDTGRLKNMITVFCNASQQKQDSSYSFFSLKFALNNTMWWKWHYVNSTTQFPRCLEMSSFALWKCWPEPTILKNAVVPTREYKAMWRRSKVPPENANTKCHQPTQANRWQQPHDRFQTSQEKNHPAEPSPNGRTMSKQIVTVSRHNILRWSVG